MDEKKKFLEFAESLKLVRKTRIEDFIEDKTVDDIYADLLPNNAIINKLCLPRTTILVGRKGTGKSTIFQKAQKDLISNKKCISIYIDVKSLYDNSTPSIPEEIKGFATDELRKYLIYSKLIELIVLETKLRLNDFVSESPLTRILGFDSTKMIRLEAELSAIESSIHEVIRKVDLSLITSFKNTQEQSKSNEVKLGAEFSATPKVEFGKKAGQNGSLKQEFESTLLTYVDIKSNLISNLLKLKQILEIDHLYIFLDDYSEIDLEAQRIFMDWFIGPLNNLSEDFVKFKIAIYPHRFYYGKLDNEKIDEISLDFFDAFYSFEKKTDITKMEMLALDYTKRLLKKRVNLFFTDETWSSFFNFPEDKLFDLLFSLSFNNPRKIGYLLSFCYESCLIYDEKISMEALENAAERYYKDIIVKYFLANQYAIKPFNDPITNEHQYELLGKIIERQKSNGSNAYRTKIIGKPTNHYEISNNLVHLLENLELNGFITTYNIIKDKNDEVTRVYSLDYGLCKRNALNFTRASNDKLIKYFSLPRFNMNILVVDYFNKTQVIRCSNNHEYPYNMLDVIKRYSMRCPGCLENNIINNCRVVISSVEIREKLQAIELSNMKKTTFDEFVLVDYLKMVDKTLTIPKIANALDKSELTIKNLINKLLERGLVKADLEASRELKKDYYLISEKGSEFITKILDMMKKMSNNQM